MFIVQDSVSRAHFLLKFCTSLKDSDSAELDRRFRSEQILQRVVMGKTCSKTIIASSRTNGAIKTLSMSREANKTLQKREFKPLSFLFVGYKTNLEYRTWVHFIIHRKLWNESLKFFLLQIKNVCFGEVSFYFADAKERDDRSRVKFC